MHILNSFRRGHISTNGYQGIQHAERKQHGFGYEKNYIIILDKYEIVNKNKSIPVLIKVTVGIILQIFFRVYEITKNERYNSHCN